MSPPPGARSLHDALAPASTRPTLRRSRTLTGSAILTNGRRTVANLLRVAAPLAAGHAVTFRRALSLTHRYTIPEPGGESDRLRNARRRRRVIDSDPADG